MTEAIQGHRKREHKKTVKATGPCGEAQGRETDESLQNSSQVRHEREERLLKASSEQFRVFQVWVCRKPLSGDHESVTRCKDGI